MGKLGWFLFGWLVGKQSGAGNRSGGVGNKLGWIIAGGIVLVLGIILAFFVFFPTPTPQTFRSLAPGMMDLPNPRVSVATVLGDLPSGDGNAGEDYNQAFTAYTLEVQNAYRANGAAIFATGEMSQELRDTFDRVVKPLLAATKKKSMNYYFQLTPVGFQEGYYDPERKKFQDVSDILLLFAGAAAKQQKFDEAEKYYLACMTMGYHMFNERSRMGMSMRGLGIMKTVCKYITSSNKRRDLATMYKEWGKPDKAEAVAALYDALQETSDRYHQIESILWENDLNKLEKGWLLWPGDIFAFATDHPDRGVRVEAILACGPIRVTATARGDKRMANKIIAEKLGSSDPIEREAAKVASELNEQSVQVVFKTKEKPNE